LQEKGIVFQLKMKNSLRPLRLCGSAFFTARFAQDARDARVIKLSQQGADELRNIRKI